MLLSSFLERAVAFMMKLAYPKCCEADIHKNSIVATIVTTDKDEISEYRQKTFSTINSDIQRFHDWLIENGCKHVCMESTGKYWIPIFNYLEHDIHVCLTHPKYIKAIKGKRQIKKTPNGLLTFLNLISSAVPLFLQKISGSFGKSQDIACAPKNPLYFSLLSSIIFYHFFYSMNHIIHILI